MGHHLHHHHFTPKILQYARNKTSSQPAATTNHVTGVPCRSKETGTRDNSPVSTHYLQNMPLTGHYNLRQIFSFLTRADERNIFSYILRKAVGWRNENRITNLLFSTWVMPDVLSSIVSRHC